MSEKLRNNHGMATTLFWVRLHEATSDINITGRVSTAMEMFLEEGHGSQGRQWATRANRKTAHRLRPSNKQLSRLQSNKVEGQKLVSLVEGEPRLFRVTNRRRATILVGESHPSKTTSDYWGSSAMVDCQTTYAKNSAPHRQ